MAIEMEGQSQRETQEIRTREIQQENMKKLNLVNDMVNNISLDGIETNTEIIKDVVLNNIESETNLDELSEQINKISQGISDIKRSQTNLNKKINDIQEKVGE